MHGRTLTIASMKYWLMKSEPDEYSIDGLARDTQSAWYGVRNYQARNYMRDEMRVGDGVLFYHSSCPEPGIAGIAAVASGPHPDQTQFDKKGKYFDEKSTAENPRWQCVDVKFIRKTKLLSLADIRMNPALEEMTILKRGNRLSITPVTAHEWRTIEKLLKAH
jgi:predicted RNA-binding protein with PUA-like domain